MRACVCVYSGGTQGCQSQRQRSSLTLMSGSDMHSADQRCEQEAEKEAGARD